MEGLVFTIAVIVVIAMAVGLLPGRFKGRRPPRTDPPGDLSAPDDWPRDGGDNPRAP